MPSNYTPNYALNQWEADDRVQRADFNADNAKIDAAIQAVKTTLSAQVSSLAGSKADKTALNALQTVVNGKGNCRIETGSYTGTGTCGVNAPNSLTFPFKPHAVLIGGDGGTAIMLANSAACTLVVGTLSVQWSLTWSGNTLSWYTEQARTFSGSFFNLNAYSQLNNSDQVYHYLVIGVADA